MRVEIEQIEDHEDGSATLKMVMDMEMLAFLAERGFLHLISQEAQKVIEEYGYTNQAGSGDVEAGEGSSGPISRELP